jgi:hypothetical protein
MKEPAVRPQSIKDLFLKKILLFTLWLATGNCRIEMCRKGWFDCLQSAHEESF